MMTESLPLILTGLNSGAGGAVRPEEDAGAAWAAGLAASVGLAAAAGAVVAAGAAAGAAGFAASVGLAAAGAVVAAGAAGADVGLAGVSGWLPQAARIGRAATASPSRRAALLERRWDRRWPVAPNAGMPT